MKQKSHLSFIVILFLFFLIGSQLYSQQKTKTNPPSATAAVVDETLMSLDAPNPAAATAPAGSSKAGVTVWDYIRTIIVLLLVIGAIYLVFFFIKKSSKSGLIENDMINVMSSLRIQGNTALHLVEVGTSVYLLGTGDNSIRLISEITDKESIDTLRLKASTIQKTKKLNFTELLSNILKPGSKDKINPDDTVKFIKDQKDRLKMM